MLLIKNDVISLNYFFILTTYVTIHVSITILSIIDFLNIFHNLKLATQFILEKENIQLVITDLLISK